MLCPAFLHTTVSCVSPRHSCPAGWLQYDATPHRRCAVARTWVRCLLTVLWGHSCLSTASRDLVETARETFSDFFFGGDTQVPSQPIQMLVITKTSFDQWKKPMDACKKWRRHQVFIERSFTVTVTFFCQQLPSCTLGEEWPPQSFLDFWATLPFLLILKENENCRYF